MGLHDKPTEPEIVRHEVSYYDKEHQPWELYESGSL